MVWIQISRTVSALLLIACTYIIWVFLSNDGPEYSDGSKGAGQAFAMIFLLPLIAFFLGVCVVTSRKISKGVVGKNKP